MARGLSARSAPVVTTHPASGGCVTMTNAGPAPSQSGCRQTLTETTSEW